MAPVLVCATLGGLITPWLLLTLTFALSAGDAVEAPTWRALLPELVAKVDLHPHRRLNGIEFNLRGRWGRHSRGGSSRPSVWRRFPGQRGLVLGVIVVIARWRRTVRAVWRRRERWAAQRSPPSVRPARARAMRAVILALGRSHDFCSQRAGLALLPGCRSEIDEPRLTRRYTAYCWRCFGTGAVVGALAMQPSAAPDGRWKPLSHSSAGVAILGLDDRGCRQPSSTLTAAGGRDV